MALSITRRGLLAGASVFMAARAMPVRAAPSPFILTAAPGKASLLGAEAGPADVWAYNGAICGPEIRAKKGEEVVVRFQNRLDQPSTVHWHGIRIDNRMDGVANLTQPPVEPGAEFDYRFTVPDAGTYWYHPHSRTWEQVARGLSGPLIIEEDEPVDVDGDHVLHLTDWRVRDDGNIDIGSLGAPMDWSHAGRMGNILTTNGQPEWSLSAAPGTRHRLRFINACNARILGVSVKGHRLTAIAVDGQPLASPLDLGTAPFTLAPAQRVDVVLDLTGKPGDRSDVIVTSGNAEVVAGTVTVSDALSRPVRDTLLPLPANAVATPGKTTRDILLAMDGGAMSWLSEATYKGQMLDGRTLAQDHNMFWAFNGVAGMPDEPLFTAKRGETIRLDMRNNTAWPHAIHFHGHHGVEVARMRGRLQPGFRDTVLVDVDETVSVAFVADNPGKWMIHCHMLEHQAAGMATWFAVA